MIRLLKKRIRIFGRKSSVLGSPMLDMIMLLIIIALLSFIIYNAFFGGTKVTNEKLSCSGITSGIMGEGTCKEKCAPEEQSFKNFGGCPPEKEKTLVYCCINPDASADSTAEVYDTTGNKEYNFEITNFKLDTATGVGCAGSPTQNCPGGTKVELVMTIKNTGSNEIYLQSVAQKTILQGGYSPIVSDHVGNTGFLEKGKTITLKITETISSGKTYTFYPGARCYDDECKKAFNSNGLQIIDYSKSITIVGK